MYRLHAFCEMVNHKCNFFGTIMEIEFDKILFGARLMLPGQSYGDTWPHKPEQGMALGLKNNKIAKIFYENEIEKFASKEITKLNGGIITPGFIDTQINGGGGALLNDDPSINTIKTIFDAHYQHGTIGILPTLITDKTEKVAPAISAVKELIEAGHDGILGIHLEGPFLSSERKGIHKPEFFLPPNKEMVDLFSSLAIAPTIITIAPEKTTPEIISAFDERPWVILSAGHTNATSREIMVAQENGLRGVTHLFNAMSQLSAREPGLVGYALEKRTLFCGIIADMHHVHPQNIRLAYDILGARNLMLVSDAMPPSATNESMFELYGKTIKVDDFACFDEQGTLAGSALTMLQAVKNMYHKIRIPLGSVLQMASETPAAFIHHHQKLGAIREGFDAKLIHLDDSLGFLGHL